MRKVNVTSNQPGAPPEQRFDDCTSDLRRGLSRDLVEGLDGDVLLRRTAALPEHLRRLLVGGRS
jgi:hypothetical protein